MSAPEFTEGSEQRPSVKLIRNASGATQIEVKAYGDDVRSASEEARSVYDELCERYPVPAKAAK